MTDMVLVLNAGSSSIKFGAFANAEGAVGDVVLKGRVEGLGVRPRLVAKDATGGVACRQVV